MKQIIFIVKSHPIINLDKIVYASTNELERDDFYNDSLNKNYLTKDDIVVDLDTVARETWDKLDGLEKLSLERIDCPIWVEKPQSNRFTYWCTWKKY